MEKQYETSDLGLAAALLSSGIVLDGMDFSNPRRVLFLFREAPSIQTTIQSYWSNQLTVDALTYFENTKLLKSRVYGGAR